MTVFFANNPFFPFRYFLVSPPHIVSLDTTYLSRSTLCIVTSMEHLPSLARFPSFSSFVRLRGFERKLKYALRYKVERIWIQQ